MLRRFQASLAHRPPTSHPSRTRRARSPRASSGYRRRFLRAAACRAAPSSSSAEYFGKPLKSSGHTMVASQHRGSAVRPYATASTCLPSETDSMARSISLSSGCGTTLAPASRRTCCQARSSGFARRWSSPVRGQAERWSPLVSRRLQQPLPEQCRRLRPSGRRSLRRSATRKSPARIVVWFDTGSVVNQ